MTISTIATLQDAAESWAERTYTDALFLQWANAVARKLERGVMGPDSRTWLVPPLRVRAMLTQSTLSTSGGSVSLPSGWLEFERIWINANDGKDLLYMPLAQFRSIADSQLTGTPTKYTIDGSTLYVAPTSDATLQVSYYTTLGAFTGDASTDAILTAYPEVYLSGVLCEAYRWARDAEGLALEQAELSGKVRGLNAQDRNAKASGSLHVMRPQSVS